ncbi:MAG TPA: glycosyltransferase family A protein, partial [Anaerolineae bacterium]|nr:glycosyltransferase family A protein [Anaerolineae bacterium]
MTMAEFAREPDGTPSGPRVSAIIPVHNGETYLAEAIESVLAQTYRPLEVLVVDDGSTDRTRDVALSYPEVIYVLQANAGTGAARNHGVRRSTGELLSFLDADDIWKPEKTALQVAALTAEPALAIVGGHMEQFVVPGQEVPYSFPEAPLPGYSACTILIRRTAFETLGGFPEHSNATEITWFAEILDSQMRLLMLPAVVARRRIHGGNISIQRREAKTHD